MDKLLFHAELFALRCSFKNLPMLCPILIGSLFYEGFYAKDGLDFPLAHGHRSVRPTRLGPSGPIFCFYPLHLQPSVIQSCEKGWHEPNRLKKFPISVIKEIHPRIWISLGTIQYLEAIFTTVQKKKKKAKKRHIPYQTVTLLSKQAFWTKLHFTRKK